MTCMIMVRSKALFWRFYELIYTWHSFFAPDTDILDMYDIPHEKDKLPDNIRLTYLFSRQIYWYWQYVTFVTTVARTKNDHILYCTRNSAIFRAKTGSLWTNKYGHHEKQIRQTGNHEWHHWKAKQFYRIGAVYDHMLSLQIIAKQSLKVHK